MVTLFKDNSIPAEARVDWFWAQVAFLPYTRCRCHFATSVVKAERRRKEAQKLTATREGGTQDSKEP